MNVPDDDDSVFKDYTLRSRSKSKSPATRQDAGGEGGHAGCGDAGEDVSALDIRPPAVSSAVITQWRHRPEVLIRGCCNYVSQVLVMFLPRKIVLCLSLSNLSLLSLSLSLSVSFPP